jgi:hypothetical protein
MSASADFLGISLATVLATERISAVLSGASDVIFSAFASSRSARTRGGSCARFSVIEHPAKMATQLNKVNLINCQLNLSTPSLSIDMDASNTPNFASILNLRLVMLFQRSLSRASLGMLSPRADTTLKAGDVSLVDTPGSGRGDQSDTLGNLARPSPKRGNGFSSLDL